MIVSFGEIMPFLRNRKSRSSHSRRLRLF